MGIIIWLITGAVAGWIAGNILKGGGFGLFGNIIVGIVGGLIGGFLLGIIGFQSTSWIADVISAVVGALVLLTIVGMVRKK